MAQEPLCFASMKVFGWQGFRGALVTFLLFVRESGLGCLDLVDDRGVSYCHRGFLIFCRHVAFVPCFFALVCDRGNERRERAKVLTARRGFLHSYLSRD